MHAEVCLTSRVPWVIPTTIGPLDGVVHICCLVKFPHELHQICWAWVLIQPSCNPNGILVCCFGHIVESIVQSAQVGWRHLVFNRCRLSQSHLQVCWHCCFSNRRCLYGGEEGHWHDGFYMCVQNCGEPRADGMEDCAVDRPYTPVDLVQCTEELVSL